MLFCGGAQGSKSMFLILAVTVAATFLKSPDFLLQALKRREIVLLLWLYGGLTLSNLLSEYNILKAQYYANEILKLAVFCALLFSLLDSWEKVFNYQTSLLVAGSLLALWGIDQYFHGNIRLEGLGGQSFGDSNAAAALFVLFLPLGLNTVVSSNTKYKKIFGSISTLVFSSAVVLTRSRAGLLGLFATISACLLRSKKKKKILLILALALAFCAPFITNEYKSRFQNITDPDRRDFSASSRLVLWQVGLRIFADNPLLGTGLLSFPHEKLRYMDKFDTLDPAMRESIFRTREPLVTHNTFVQVLSDGGIVSALSYYLLIFGCFFSNSRFRKTASNEPELQNSVSLLSNIEAGIIGYCCCCFFIDAFSSVFLPIQITIGAIIRNQSASHLPQFETVPHALQFQKSS
jgi:O-antigen ligase